MLIYTSESSVIYAVRSLENENTCHKVKNENDTASQLLHCKTDSKVQAVRLVADFCSSRMVEWIPAKYRKSHATVLWLLFFIVKGIYTRSAIKAVGTLRRIVPLQLLGRLRESADLNSDDGTALLMERMDETSVYQPNAEKKNPTTNKHRNKQKQQQQQKRDEAESNKPTQLEALWNWGWKRSIQCLKLLGLQ